MTRSRRGGWHIEAMILLSAERSIRDNFTGWAIGIKLDLLQGEECCQKRLQPGLDNSHHLCQNTDA